MFGRFTKIVYDAVVEILDKTPRKVKISKVKAAPVSDFIKGMMEKMCILYVITPEQSKKD